MRGLQFCISVFLLIVCLLSPVWSQDFSEREQIAIFRLSYYGQPPSEPPPGLKIEVRGRRGSISLELRGSGNEQVDRFFSRALGAVDERIRSAFINLGRFDVIGMNQRLTAGDVNEFINVLSEFERARTDLPEAVLLGQQAFTEADFRELAGGFIVVVPSVSWYSLSTDDSGMHSAEIETSFTFINVENLTTFAQFFITTTGSDEDEQAAIGDAVNDISGELAFRLRSMDEFRIKTGVLEIDGQEVILEFGRNMGLEPGDEYAIVSERVLSSGHIASAETGLILITDVQSEFSTARVLYANPSVAVGDQLQEVPRRGVEISGYLDVLNNGTQDTTYVIGARGVASRGFFPWRPSGAVEVPLRGLIGGGSPAGLMLLPINVLVGGEWTLLFGRIRVTPGLAVGLGGAVPLDSEEDAESFYLSHLGGRIGVNGSVLITRDIRLFVEAGFAYWHGLQPDSVAALFEPLTSYGGLLIGGGITFK